LFVSLNFLKIYFIMTWFLKFNDITFHVIKVTNKRNPV
jgi:hypothetical protein